MTTTVLDIQKALQAKGFDPGPLDGQRGRRTVAAIMAFQSACKLKSDGIVGSQTLAKLMPEADVEELTLGSSLPWLDEAYRLVGLKEDTSAGSNEQILQFARDLQIPYFDDDVPWCGLFVSHCIASQLPQEPLPTNSLGARQFERFGDKAEPQTGAVMVFWREGRDSGKGHVGFYVGEDRNGNYLLLGGNQGDQVSIIAKPMDRFVCARWPKTALPPTGKRLVADVANVVATGRDQREA